jgi:type 1 glutamine amidotransferase
MRKLAILMIPLVCLVSSLAWAQRPGGGPTTESDTAMGGDVDDQDQKRVLAILGDGWHRVAPLDRHIVGKLRQSDWEAVVIMDYDVPFDDFDEYDLIVLSREGHEFVQYYRERDTKPQPKERSYWLTPDEAQKFEDYVNAGGRLFLFHDGFGNYPCDYAIARLARSCFISHPAIVEINVSPTGKMPELTEGVTPFVVSDEEYVVEMDESETSVFLESHSPEHGRSAQGWAHTYNEGRVAVLIPGHRMDTIAHPSINLLIQNILNWLTE